TFLALGRAIRQGVELERRPVRDVAPTLAVLAGLPTPEKNLGRPMLDVAAWPPSAKARALAGPLEQAAGVHCALHEDATCGEAPELVRRLAAGDQAAVRVAEAWLDR